MKQKSKKSGNKTQKSHNQGGYPNEPKTFPSKPNGAKDQLNYAGNKVAQNSNENAWSRSRHSSVSDMWSDADEHFPALGASASSVPKVNVWEERKSKQEAIKALEPMNEYDEEAMLQHALALSLLEATEEQQRRKIDDDYMMQLEKLQFSSEDVEGFDVPEEFIMDRTSNIHTDIPVNKQPQVEKYSKNSVLKSNQKDNIYYSEESKFEGDFSAKEEHKTERHTESSISNNSQNKKSYISAGARPKINKAIEAFGGWGLKDNKRKNPEKITEFIDDVVSEKSNSYNKTFHDKKSKEKHTNENNYSGEKNVLPLADVKNTEHSAFENLNGNDEILYDEEGTFLDYDDSKWSDSKNETNNQQCISPSTVLDTWLNSKDDDFNDEIINKNSTAIFNDTKPDNYIPPPFYNSEKQKIDDEIMSTSKDLCSSTVTTDFEPKIINNIENLSHETSESTKSIWPNATDYKNQDLSENKNECKYDACGLNANSFTPFHEPTEVPTLTSCKIWSDKSSNDSAYFSSYSDNLTRKLESVNINSDIDNEVFNVASSNDSDVPPIPPPKPPATATDINDSSASPSGISNSSGEMKSPPVLQSHPLSGMQVPQFPTVVNPILNPMFPAFNPMLGCGIDPLLMRRMLILTNPFLANQLIAMEEYYRSMGISVDLFSMPTSLPNMPAMLNPSLLQNPLASSVSGNIQQLQSEIHHLQTQIDASAESVNKSTFKNVENESCKKCPDPPRIDAFLDVNKSVVSSENCNEDPWYKSFLSNDNASIIPPPKPPSGEVNCNNLISVPQKSEFSQIDSSSDNIAHAHASNHSVDQLSNSNKNKEFKPIIACIPKKEVSGWDDPEDDFADVQNLKSHNWDDGWGDPIAPPKPLRNPSLQEDRKKTVFRQPAKQPQIGRYQKNFSYS